MKDAQADVVLALAAGELPEAAARVVGFVAPDLAQDRALIDAVVAAAEDLGARRQ